METKRRMTEKRLSSTARYFRRVLYGLVGIVLSSYVVLFILVVSRHIDHAAQDDVRRAVVAEETRAVSLVGGVGPSFLRMDRYVPNKLKVLFDISS